MSFYEDLERAHAKQARRNKLLTERLKSLTLPNLNGLSSERTYLFRFGVTMAMENMSLPERARYWYADVNLCEHGCRRNEVGPSVVTLTGGGQMVVGARRSVPEKRLAYQPVFMCFDKEVPPENARDALKRVFNPCNVPYNDISTYWSCGPPLCPGSPMACLWDVVCGPGPKPEGWKARLAETFGNVRSMFLDERFQRLEDISPERNDFMDSDDDDVDANAKVAVNELDEHNVVLN